MNTKQLVDLVKFRAKLGRWMRDDAWILFKVRDHCPTNDSRTYSIVHLPGRYRTVQRFDVTEKELLVYMANTVANGYKQVEKTYPELQEYFNDRGQLRTPMVKLREACENSVVTAPEKSGVEFLLDMF
jgi:hypothetical protein